MTDDYKKNILAYLCGKTEKQTSVGNEFVLLDKIKPNTTLQVKIIKCKTLFY